MDFFKFYAFILDICIYVPQCFSEMNLHCLKYCVKVLKLIKNQASYFLQSCNISLYLNFYSFQYCLNLCPVRVFFYIFISVWLYFIEPLIYVYHKLKEKSLLTSRQGMLVVSLTFFYLCSWLYFSSLSNCSYYELNDGGRAVIPKLHLTASQLAQISLFKTNYNATSIF